MEEEYDFSVDVGRYLETLIRQRWLIIGAAVVCAAAAVVAVLLLPKSYEARALVATIKSESSVSFGSSIKTLSEEALLASGSGAYRIMDPTERLNSYVQLVKNPAIAQDVLAEIGDQLPEEARSESKLLEMVSGDIASGSDSIEIVASSDDPQLAAQIANAWARAYTRHINAIYSTGSSEDSYSAVLQQTADAEQKYESAQADLAAFEKENRIDGLNRQIDELQAVIEGLSSSRVIAVRSVISDVVRVEGLLKDAQDMRAQVSQGGEAAAASNALALTLLKAQAFSSHGEATAGLILQTSPADLTAQGMLSDLDGLIGSLQTRLATLEQEAQALPSGLVDSQASENVDLSGIGSQSAEDAPAGSIELTSGMPDSQSSQTILMLEARVRALKARLVEEQGRQQTLTRTSELAWEAYKELQTKESELRIASQTQGSEVSLAATAAVPDQDTVSGGRTVLLAGVVGLMLGIGAAYLFEFWWGYKGVEIHPITLRDLLGKR